MASSMARQTIEALAQADMERFVQLSRQLDTASNAEANNLIGAVFYLAVNRRWKPSDDSATIRSFVADMRSSMESERGEIDPIASEDLIFAAITGDTTKMEAMDPNTVFRLESLITFNVIQEFNMSNDEIQSFLTESEGLAAEWARA